MITELAAISDGLYERNSLSVSWNLQIQQHISYITLLLSKLRMRKYLSMHSTGPVNVMLKPKRTKMSCSRFSSSPLVTFFFSSSERCIIIRSKDGAIGCSSFAAINKQIVLKRHIYSLGKFQCPTAERQRSKRLAAMNRVSILYYFLK